MTLSAGSRIGHYGVQASLGAGGMGQLYRARDTKLDRDVAIKILASFLQSLDVLAYLECPTLKLGQFLVIWAGRPRVKPEGVSEPVVPHTVNDIL